MDVSIVSSRQEGSKYIITCQVVLDGAGLSMEEAAQIVKNALSGIDQALLKLASIKIDAVQAAVNKQVGVSPLVFAAYANR